MRIEIKKADTTRVYEISKVINETWQSCYKDMLTAEDIKKYTDTAFREKHTMEGMNNGREYFLINCDDEVVGICSTEQSRESDLVHGYCSILQLYVLPEFQNKGLGKKLLSHTLREMRRKGYKNALLWTQAQNAAARRFYERIGFVSDTKGVGTMFKKPIDIVRYVIEL